MKLEGESSIPKPKCFRETEGCMNAHVSSMCSGSGLDYANVIFTYANYTQ